MSHARIILRCLIAALSITLAGCETLTGKPAVTPSPAPAPSPAPTPVTPPVTTGGETPAPKPPVAVNPLRVTTWDAIENWRDDNPALAWSAFMTSCGTLKNQPAWQSVCSVALALGEPSRETAIRFFETNFTPYQVVNTDGTETEIGRAHV